METKKRRSTRVQLDWAVTVESRDGVYGGTMKDISLHGIFVRTDGIVPLGEDVSVCFIDPECYPSRSVRIGAVVVRNEGGGVALSTRKMDLDSVLLLRGIVGSRVG